MTEVYFKRLFGCYLFLLLLVAGYRFVAYPESLLQFYGDETATFYTHRNRGTGAAPAICNISADETVLQCNSAVLTVDAGVSGYTWFNGSTSRSITVTESGIYWWQFRDMTRNTAINGNFSGGNSGFNSEYAFRQDNKSDALFNEKTYSVTSNPRNVHTGFSSFTDHTRDAGALMMVVNGSLQSNTSVWSQSISVLPNTFYVFSIWGASAHKDNPGRLTFSINGTQIGNIDLTSTPGEWKEFTTEWSSGNSTTASIAIVNLNTAQGGNDFALDDIVFAPICRKNFNVTIYKNPPKPAITNRQQ